MPAPGTAWPPKDHADIAAAYDTWSAWYSNEVAQLSAVYGRTTTRPGLLNRVASWFWTPKDTVDTVDDQGLVKLHVPVASDLCQVSADLLFSEPPAVTVEDPKANTKAQERLDLIAGAGFDQTMTSFAEVSAALGGGYLRITWDGTLRDHVFLTKVDADGAIPEFRYGHLTGVTFWRVVGTDASRVFRHVERHELDSFGVGVIIHGLYEGTTDNLGSPRALADHPATEHLAAVVDADSTVSTETPGLAVGYAPNIGPNRRWRLNPAGANLGRSDLDGIEPLMDALDRVYSSLMRDIELGKGRALVSSTALDDNGPGRGATFNVDKAVFTGLKIPPDAMKDAKFPVEVIQFKIRVDEHLTAAAALYGQIIRTAGYSAQTFGEKDESGGNTTATEVTAKERRTYLTRDRKIRNLKPVLETLLSKALEVDAKVFNTGVQPVPVTVTFADAVQESMESLARTAQLLRAAEAAATKTLVAMVHPDWDEEDIKAEAEAIRAERSMFPDPGLTGTVPADEVTDGTA
ncbi:hypothetical protein ASG71_07935 [Arthrobacter sp. Soil763]|nr:hypothetical protein ASG71_07935 [Arthrobacter sp. Soil763]